MDQLDDGIESELWTRLVEGRDSVTRERLVELHLPFVRMHAAKLYAARQIPQIEFAEFYQYGVIGLLEALDRYDPTRGVQFRTFAAHRIEGSILNGVTRYNEQQEQIALRARLKKEQRLTLLKGSTEDGHDTKFTFARLAEIAVGMALGYMLDESGMYASHEEESADQAYANIELKQLKAAIATLVNRLPEQQKHVIKCHYFWGMGIEEIGLAMGVTKGRVSQVHRQGLATLLHTYRKEFRLSMEL